MSSEAAILKEFLVSLGFQIDKGSEDKFKKTVADTTKKVVKLGSAVVATASMITAGVAKIAEDLEKLYFASKRTDSSVANIKSLQFAIANMGGTAEGALGALENLARFLRNSPGAEGLLNNIGVQTRNANGAMRDTVDVVQDLSKVLAEMPYYKANAYAQALGLDEKSLMAMREGLDSFSEEYKGLLNSVGLDVDEAAKNSHNFMVELRSLSAVFSLLAQKIASGLMSRLGDNINKLRGMVVANFGRISNVISGAVNIILQLVNVINTLVYRGTQLLEPLVDWFNNLSDSTQTFLKWLTIIAAAWKFLNLSFLATPLGIITALITSLGLLWDDYQTWKEGGKTLIDWEEWAPGIEAAINGIRKLKFFFNDMIAAMRITIEPLMKYVEMLLDGIGRLASWTGFKLATNKASTPAAPSQAAPSSEAPSTNQPRGIRNNNPGNLNYVGQIGATKEQGPNGRFAVFGTSQEGLDALAKQLQLYGKRGVDTTQSIIGKFAPPNENNTRAYINTVASNLGVSPETRLNLKDPAQLATVMDAIIKVENGRNPYTSEMLTSAATKSIGGANPTINQTTNITVSGSSDPRSTAKDVSVAQNGVNERLVRNMRGAVLQ